jgi:propanol-preferring alcohol dehydrogenase
LDTQLAMTLVSPKTPLVAVETERPTAGAGQVVVRVRACGVCRTDLHLVDGELPDPKLPIVPGHEIVGEVTELGEGAAGIALGQRVGVPWLGWTCGACRYCAEGRENLCDAARFVGYQIDGGYARFAVADARFVLPLPAGYSDAEVAPLLCAGLIGYRALRMAGHAERLGLYGFGASAHLVAQIARFEGRRVYAFTRAGDAAAQQLALDLGAVWAGASDQAPPEPLDAAILFAPVGALVPAALRATAKGATVVCAGIHMSPIPELPYDLLWGERAVRSVANLTREDGRALLEIAPRAGLRAQVTRYPLVDANRALDDLRQGRFAGAAVIEV